MKTIVNLKREFNFLTLLCPALQSKDKGQKKVYFSHSFLLVLMSTSLALYELIDLYLNSIYLVNYLLTPIFTTISSSRSYSIIHSKTGQNVASSIINTPANLDNKLNPWFITGIIDAEGMFMIKLKTVSKLKTGWSVEPVFQIDLHTRDEKLLRLIR